MNQIKKLPMSTLSTPHRVISYLVILVGYFFYCYNFSIIDFVRPYLRDSYNLSLTQTALFYSAQSVGALIGAIFTAQFAEQFGRKRVLIFITLLNGLATIANMSFIDFNMWMILRFIIGISLGGYFTAAVGIIAGMFTQKWRVLATGVASATFSVALIVMGILGAFIAKDSNWELLMWIGGIPPVITGILMIFVVPDDRKYIPYGQTEAISEEEKTGIVRKGTWKEMFSNGYAKYTLLCIFLAAFNVLAYQFFGGFVTTYLKDVRMFDPTIIGILFSAQSTGGLIGNYVWSFIGNTWGRILNLIGFVMAGIILVLYFIVPSDPTLIGILAFVYGFSLGSSAIWGGYFTEIFPEHLRSMGASLFHASRILSFFAPVIVAVIAEKTNLVTGMALAPAVWMLAAIVWFFLPETLTKGILYKGYIPTIDGPTFNKINK